MGRLYGVVERLILVVVLVEGVERGGGQRGDGRPPTACRERELEAGAELEGSTKGHNTLFSPLNPSVTCHTFVMDGERKTVEKKKGWGGWGKEQLDVLLDFFCDCERRGINQATECATDIICTSLLNCTVIAFYTRS